MILKASVCVVNESRVPSSTPRLYINLEKTTSEVSSWLTLNSVLIVGVNDKEIIIIIIIMHPVSENLSALYKLIHYKHPQLTQRHKSVKKKKQKKKKKVKCCCAFASYCPRPDITVMVGWVLKISYLSIYLSIYHTVHRFAVITTLQPVLMK